MVVPQSRILQTVDTVVQESTDLTTAATTTVPIFCWYNLGTWGLKKQE